MNGPLIGKPRIRCALGMLCLFALLAPTAQAADGRISFHGAVRTPTCAPTLPATASPRAFEAVVQACPEASVPGQASSSRLYSVHVQTMPGDMLQHEAYPYVAAFMPERGHLKLVVQRFE